MDLLGTLIGTLLFPVGTQGCDEFLPVDKTSVVTVKHIGHFFHFVSIRVEFRIDDSIDEITSRDQSVVVLVHLTEEICQPRFLVVHELQEPLPPIVPREVIGAFFFFEVSQMGVQLALSLP